MGSLAFEGRQSMEEIFCKSEKSFDKWIHWWPLHIHPLLDIFVRNGSCLLDYEVTTRIEYHLFHVFIIYRYVICHSCYYPNCCAYNANEGKLNSNRINLNFFYSITFQVTCCPMFRYQTVSLFAE